MTDLDVDGGDGSVDDAAPAGVAGGVGDGGLGGRRDVGRGHEVIRVARLRLVDDGPDVDRVRGVWVWREKVVDLITHIMTSIRLSPRDDIKILEHCSISVCL